MAKSIKEAKQKSETETAVDAYLVEIGVSYVVHAAGKGLKRDDWECDGWRADFASKTGAREQFDYYTGIGYRVYNTPAPRASRNSMIFADWEKTHIPFPPFAASVLYSLVSDSDARHESFRDWCATYDYDSDSIKALNIYNACCENAERLARVFTREQIAHLETLLQDY